VDKSLIPVEKRGFICHRKQWLPEHEAGVLDAQEKRKQYRKQWLNGRVARGSRAFVLRFKRSFTEEMVDSIVFTQKLTGSLIARVETIEFVMLA
jgi:hypothetical protein